MKPGQITPNELELAILDRLAAQAPNLRPRISGLHVLSREFTGVGSYTRFQCEASGPESRLWLNSLIELPGVTNGMGALLLSKDEEPECLEIFTYGFELWDGTFDGFVIAAVG